MSPGVRCQSGQYRKTPHLPSKRGRRRMRKRKTRGKNNNKGKSSKETEDIRRNEKIILELKSIIINKKFSLVELDSIPEMTGEIIGDLELETVEIVQSK